MLVMVFLSSSDTVVLYQLYISWKDHPDPKIQNLLFSLILNFGIAQTQEPSAQTFLQ